MLGTNTLVDLYRAEREHLSDPLFDSPFPGFKDWAVSYETDFRSNHITVTTEEADIIMETTVAQANAELSADTSASTLQGASGSEVSTTVTSTVSTGESTANAGTTEETTTVTKHRPARAKGKAKRVTKQASPKSKKSTKQVKAKSSGPKKSDIVRELMADKSNKKLARKELLTLIQKKAKLSAAAANTYLYAYR